MTQFQRMTWRLSKLSSKVFKKKVKLRLEGIKEGVKVLFPKTSVLLSLHQLNWMKITKITLLQR